MKKKYNVMIAGHTGFIGGHLDKYLRGKYNISHSFDRHNPDVIINLVGLYKSEHEFNDIEPMIESNIRFGTELLECMEEVNCNKIINIGTSFQHYKNKKYSPVNLYAATKQAYQDILMYYTEAEGINCINLKFYDTYGPGDQRKKLFNILRDARVTKRVLHMTKGEQDINLVYVDDVCRAIDVAIKRLLTNKVKGYEEWAIGADRTYKLINIVKGYKNIYSKSDLNIEFDKPYKKREVMKPWNKGKRLPGWEPKIDLIEGLRRMTNV